MAILTYSGRAALAAALKYRPLHIAWGTGNPAWDTGLQAPSINENGLVAEIGRRTILIAQYCTPDDAGLISIPGGRFTVSPTPTHWLYIRATFDYSDAPTSMIREVAIFSGTEVVAGLPAGQMYFEPNQVSNPGLLLAIDRFPAISRSPSVRQSFDFVLDI